MLKNGLVNKTKSFTALFTYFVYTQRTETHHIKAIVNNVNNKSNNK